MKKSMYIVAIEQHLMENESGSFGNDYARNIIIFGVDNTSLSHTDNLKNNFFGV